MKFHLHSEHVIVGDKLSFWKSLHFLFLRNMPAEHLQLKLNL